MRNITELYIIVVVGFNSDNESKCMAFSFPLFNFRKLENRLQIVKSNKIKMFIDRFAFLLHFNTIESLAI